MARVQEWEVTLDVRGEVKVLVIQTDAPFLAQAAAEVQAIKTQLDWQKGVRCTFSRFLREVAQPEST